MRELGEALRGEMRAMNDGTCAQIEETRAQMRALHEDMIARFNLLDEHPRWKRTTAPRRPKR